MNMITLGIHGGSGRLGRRILALGLQDRRFALRAVVVRASSAGEGLDAGELAGLAPVGLIAQAGFAALLGCDVVIDVSSPAAGSGLATWLAAQNGGPPLVTGTTGWNAKEEQALHAAALHIALLRSGNFSLGITALLHNVRDNAARLGSDWGVHIHDSHHSAKKDAPSGTALMLAKAVCEGWGRSITPTCLPVGASLDNKPEPSTITISATRAGDVIGHHDVWFYGPGESLRLSHDAQTRDIFARGALQAAHWIANKPVGLYGMDDVLITGTD